MSACVGGDLHEIGMRIVTDLFEMEGWDTYYLGANTPPSGVRQTVDERRPVVLLLSATMTFHLQALRETIHAVRSSREGRDVRVIVGGRVFNVVPDLWQEVSADGCARDSKEAVALARGLIQERERPRQ